MKRMVLAAAMTAAALMAPANQQPKVSRAALEAMEASFDKRIMKLSLDDPLDLLGATRGVYLEGYGAVFSAELSLVITPALSPFRMTVTKEEVERLRQRKLERLPVLKRVMREMLVDSAASLDAVPAEEQIVVAVSLFYYSWENRNGLPSQLLMQAPKKTLLDYQAGRIREHELQAALRTQEL